MPGDGFAGPERQLVAKAAARLPAILAESRTIDELAALDDAGGVLLPMAEGIADLPALEADDEAARAVGNGVVFTAGTIGDADPGTYRVLGSDGRLLATYVADGRRAKPEVVVA